VPAKLTLHPPQRATRFLVLRDGETLEVGRHPDCTLVIESPHVSARHARLRWTGCGWALEDLGSKNGTMLNGLPVTLTMLADGDWLSFGGILGHFHALTEEALQRLDAERLARLETSLQLRRRLAEGMEPMDLLLRFLEIAVELVGARRGFVLMAGADGALQVELATGFGSGPDDRFAGSVGALHLALQTGQPVVIADAQKDPFFGKRPSVVGMGLGALACLPIRVDERLLGLLYVDGTDPSADFTELDVEILQSLSEHAALAIESMRLERRVRRLSAASTGDPALLALQRRIAPALAHLGQ
jgi:adenylate cyclase